MDMKKNMLLLFLTLSFAGSYAQEKKGFQFSFNHQALAVKNLQQAADFYTKTIGLEEITNRTKMEGIRWFSFGAGQELHLISILPGEVKVTKAVHVALTTPRFDDFKKHLDESGINYSDWPGKPQTVNLRADGIKQIFLQDTEGYWIEVNSVGTK